MRSWIHHALWVSVFLVYSSGFTTFPPFASKGSQLFQSQGSLSAKSILLATTLLSAERLEENHPIGLYIHIPYCRRRCRYCNFAIVPIGSVSTEPTLPEDDGRASRGFEEMNRNYLKSLLTEIRNIQLVNGTQISLGSIYFGGGTPSLAPIKMIATILHEICCDENSPFSLETNAEITMEMDPGTFSAEKLQALKELGINRISLGVQSFNDTILSAMGRVHRRSDTDNAVKAIESVYGTEEANYSIDLISGVPGLTQALWVETLEQATALVPPPSHMSIYDLQIEKGTVFSTWYSQSLDLVSKFSPPSLPTENDCAFMYKYASGYLKSKNYEHYEVSSYALPSRRSRHNQIYWAKSSSWYAFGLGATSFVSGRLLARPKTLVDYHAWVDAQRSEDETQQEVMTNDEYLTDIIMKRLRTSDGLDLKWITDCFGPDITESIREGAQLALQLDLAETITNEQNKEEILRLKDPGGLLYSNYIISSIFAELGYE